MKLFTKHPAERDMTYLQHFFYAFSLAGKFYLLGFTSFIHAFFPFLFKETVSRKIREIYLELHPNDLNVQINIPDIASFDELINSIRSLSKEIVITSEEEVDTNNSCQCQCDGTCDSCTCNSSNTNFSCGCQ